MWRIMKRYTVTRNQAASLLWVSTRTIDRYIKSWKLSYKKVANKVLLAKEEIASLQEDYGALHQEISTEVVKQTELTTPRAVSSVNPSLEKAVEEKIDKFMLIFNEKDKILEEKNKVIFMLQQRVWELEAKLKTMVALPDYTKEKQEALLEKQKLEEKIAELKWTVKREKSKSVWFLAVAVIFILILIYFVLFKA